MVVSSRYQIENRCTM